MQSRRRTHNITDDQRLKKGIGHLPLPRALLGLLQRVDSDPALFDFYLRLSESMGNKDYTADEFIFTWEKAIKELPPELHARVTSNTPNYIKNFFTYRNPFFSQYLLTIYNQWVYKKQSTVPPSHPQNAANASVATTPQPQEAPITTIASDFADDNDIAVVDTEEEIIYAANRKFLFDQKTTLQDLIDFAERNGIDLTGKTRKIEIRDHILSKLDEI